MAAASSQTVWQTLRRDSSLTLFPFSFSTSPSASDPSRIPEEGVKGDWKRERRKEEKEGAGQESGA